MLILFEPSFVKDFLYPQTFNSSIDVLFGPIPTLLQKSIY